MFARKSLAVLILVALLLSLFASIAGAQQPSTYAAITVTGVTSGTPAVGSDFTTDVEVSINTTTGTGVGGVEAYIGYLPTYVTPVDTNTSVPGVQPAELRSDFFGVSPIPAANEVLAFPNCPGGFANCIHVSLAGPEQTNKTGLIARLHWQGLAAGTAGFVILNPYTAPPPPPPTSASPLPTPTPPVPVNPALRYTALSDSNGYLIPLNTYGISPVAILDATYVGIGGIVLRQGVPPTLGSGTQGCTQINATSGIGFAAGPAFTLVAPPPDLPAQVNTAGGFRIAISSGGTYTIRASYPGYLQSQKPNVYVSGGLVLIGTTRLVGGDVNGDNTINILDIVTIISQLGTGGSVGSAATVCVPPIEGANGLPPTVSAPPDSAVDINDDGVVNVSDLAIAAGNFGKSGPTPWQP